MALRFLPGRATQTGVLPSYRQFSTSSRSASYADTLQNLKIGAHTRVLFQGFTGEIWFPSQCLCGSTDAIVGRQATANVKESLEWGTKIVGGVKPGVEGEHLGLPVFPSVRVVCIRVDFGAYTSFDCSDYWCLGSRESEA